MVCIPRFAHCHRRSRRGRAGGVPAGGRSTSRRTLRYWPPCGLVRVVPPRFLIGRFRWTGEPSLGDAVLSAMAPGVCGGRRRWLAACGERGLAVPVSSLRLRMLVVRASASLCNSRHAHYSRLSHCCKLQVGSEIFEGPRNISKYFGRVAAHIFRRNISG